MSKAVAMIMCSHCIGKCCIYLAHYTGWCVPRYYVSRSGRDMVVSPNNKIIWQVAPKSWGDHNSLRNLRYLSRLVPKKRTHTDTIGFVLWRLKNRTKMYRKFGFAKSASVKHGLEILRRSQKPSKAAHAKSAAGTEFIFCPLFLDL
jgi:hypothetical protein